jgi:predicted nucleic acid-binding protein
MGEVTVGVLDTSVLIAQESGQTLGELPDRVTLSIVTLGELEVGVLVASSPAERARRADTLRRARRWDPVPITEAIMSAWARLVADCHNARMHRTLKIADTLIAATAIDLGLPLVTRDDDYDQMARAHAPLDIIKV